MSATWGSRAARSGCADNGVVESALLEHLVAAGGPAAESWLRWVVFGESLPAGRDVLDAVWPQEPVPL
jgi:hypothetical protein